MSTGNNAQTAPSLSSLSPDERRLLLAPVRVVATDVDGTLTRQGVIESRTLEALEALAAAGVEVIPVSGRAAGEVAGLCRYLPGVRRAIAENGALALAPDEPIRWLVPEPDLEELLEVGSAIGAEVESPLERAPDHHWRLGDVAYERAGRDEPVLRALRDAAAARGRLLVWSNVHIHITQHEPDKGAGLLTVLGRTQGPCAEVLTIGDAPNDAGLFVDGRFGVPVGTADVLAQWADLPHRPRYVTQAREGAAFEEMAAMVVESRRAAV